jgi:hypothetical protein
MVNLVEDFKILRNQADPSISDIELKKCFKENGYDIVKTLLELDGISQVEENNNNNTSIHVKKIRELREIANLKDNFLSNIIKNNKIV